MERAQKFCCRLILRDWSYNTTYDSLLSRLNLQPLWISVFQRRLCLIHSYITGCRYFPSGVIVLLKNSAIRSSPRNHTNTILIPNNIKFSRYTNSAFITSSIAYNTLSTTDVTLSIKQFKKLVSTLPFFIDMMCKIQHFNSKIVQVLDM